MDTQVLAREGEVKSTAKRPLRRPAARAEDLSASSSSSTHALPAAAPAVLDITVLMGGPSAEREVSLVSGAAIADALAGLGHRITRADISPADTSALDRKGIDVVFIALHGSFGESGEVQTLCERRGLRYTGSPPRASELAIDKAASKEAFRRAGIITPEWAVIDSSHTDQQNEALRRSIPLPVVVKPVDGGSSVDVTIARRASGRDRAAADVLVRYGRAMVERFIQGREFTVGILGDDVLPVLEIIPKRKFYDYRAKYTDCGTRYVFDHGLPEGAARAMQEAALAAHRCLGCRDMSRVDFMLDAAMTPYLLEVNTIPGFTGHSLLPMAARQVGISFPQLVGRIVDMAMKRG
ncbi:MAG: D-alanine--D-alanine ligase [Phycisphaerae bacterium]